MADVRGFRAYRYNHDKVGNLDLAITPPFDVITPEEREHLAGRSPYNYTHIILPQEGDGLDKYQHAARAFSTWIEQDILRQDDEDSFYLLEQSFRDLDGNKHIRRAFFGVTRIPEANEDVILGHERTFDWKVTDRLSLTQAVRAHTGAVFALYDDPHHELKAFLDQMSGRPEDGLAHTIDGTTQRYWRVPADPRVTEFFKDKRLYIADGHHRFRTAVVYRDQARKALGTRDAGRCEFVLMGYVANEDPGLFVYPAHRVLDAPADFDIDTFLEAIREWFDVESVDGDLVGVVQAEQTCALGFAHASGVKRLFRLKDIDRVDLLGDAHGPAWRDLDVSVLHGGILERILGLPVNAEFVYEKDPQAALAVVERNEKDIVFVLRNMHPTQVCACANAKEFMPQKATYFFPKLCSGAVIHRFE